MSSHLGAQGTFKGLGLVNPPLFVQPVEAQISFFGQTRELR